MKATRQIILTTLVLLLIKATPAEAALYLTGDSQFGPNSITVDTSTDLGWLNLRETAGLSYEQVSTELGGTFSGFRYATQQEVLGLFSSAGIPLSGAYPLSTPSIQSLFSLIGTTQVNGQPGALAMSGTSRDGGYIAPAIYAAESSVGPEYLVDDGSVAYGTGTTFPELSSWLVTTVPEPADAGLFTLAAAVWCAFTCFHWRKCDLGRRAVAAF